MRPAVSVVIPTRGRSHLVPRAVRSVLAQTMGDLEVVVVIDGADPATIDALSVIDDTRLRVLELPEQRGGSAARNRGVTASTAEWVAFLDDDDEWLPPKLERQLEVAASCDGPRILACRLEFRTPEGVYVGPRRLPRRGETVADYLLDRRSLFRDEGAILTSMLLAPRGLLLAIPFDPELPRHQDADLVLRACFGGRACLVYVDQVLGIFHSETQSGRVSVTDDWRRSLEWIRDRRHYVTPRGYAGFLLSHVSSAAARTREPGAFIALLREAFATGRPRPIHVAIHCAMWMFPQGARRAIRRRLLSWRRGGL